MGNEKAFHAPLKLNDTETQTVGCRHTDPDICSRNMMPKKCAYARDDGICMEPPISWKKQYQKLKNLDKNV